MLNIPPLSQEQFFWFKFKGDNGNKKREGTLIPIEETTQPPPKPGHKKHPSYDYRDKKHHEVLQSEAHHLSWCVTCPSQATHVLLFRNHGVWQLQKYCTECLTENVIKL